MTWLKEILYTSITLLNKYTTPLSKHLAKDIRQLSKNINMFIPLLVPKENAAVGFAPNILFLVVKFLIGTNLKQKKCSITLTMFNCHIYYSVRLKKMYTSSSEYRHCNFAYMYQYYLYCMHIINMCYDTYYAPVVGSALRSQN